jgi:hypothetical protein
LAEGEAEIVHICDSGFTIYVWREGKTPNPKHQAPEKLQAPNPKHRISRARRSLEFEFWRFSGFWILVFGIFIGI